MKKKTRKEWDEATLASVKKELAKPRMARSACKEEVNLIKNSAPSLARVFPVLPSSTSRAEIRGAGGQYRRRLGCFWIF